MGYKVAVVGATGNVGREMMNVLADRKFPADEVFAIASRRSQGTEVSYGDKTLKCKDLEQFDFTGIDICLMSAGATVSKEWSPRIGAQGAVVIDNSSCWRYDQDVPLVVPEVNANAIAGYTKKNIIANPNCSTAQIVVVLKPLHDAATIKRVVVSTYQSMSGAGKEAMDELWQPDQELLRARPTLDPKKFTKHIAFNVIPQIDVFMEDGSTKEEWKMVVETKKILDPRSSPRDLRARADLRRSRRGRRHRVREPLEVEAAREILVTPPALRADKREPGGYATPVECAVSTDTYVEPHSARMLRSRRVSHRGSFGQSAEGRSPQRRSNRRGDDRR